MKQTCLEAVTLFTKYDKKWLSIHEIHTVTQSYITT